MARPDLGDAGQRLYDAVVTKYSLNEIELEMLTSACRHADMIARLQELLADSLLTVGAQGQPKLDPAIGELRNHRLALSRLLTDMALPPDVDEDDAGGSGTPPVSFNSRRASKAATMRHKRNRMIAARRERAVGGDS